MNLKMEIKVSSVYVCWICPIDKPLVSIRVTWKSGMGSSTAATVKPCTTLVSTCATWKQSRLRIRDTYRKSAADNDHTNFIYSGSNVKFQRRLKFGEYANVYLEMVAAFLGRISLQRASIGKTGSAFQTGRLRKNEHPDHRKLLCNNNLRGPNGLASPYLRVFVQRRFGRR